MKTVDSIHDRGIWLKPKGMRTMLDSEVRYHGSRLPACEVSRCQATHTQWGVMNPSSAAQKPFHVIALRKIYRQRQYSTPMAIIMGVQKLPMPRHRKQWYMRACELRS